MYIPSKLCKMQCLLNHVLENLTYLLFYSTFWVVILLDFLKLPKLLIHSLIMHQKLFKYMKSMFEVLFAYHFPPYLLWKKFCMAINVNLLVSKASNRCFKRFGFLSNALSFSQLANVPNKFT